MRTTPTVYPVFDQLTNRLCGYAAGTKSGSRRKADYVIGNIYHAVAPSNVAVLALPDVIGGGLADAEAVGTTHTSDFSAGVGGYGGFNGTVAGNIDGVSDGVTSKDDCLRYYGNATNGIHRSYKTGILTAGLFYDLRLNIYVPNGQTNVDGFWLGTTTLAFPYYGTGGLGYLNNGRWYAARTSFLANGTILAIVNMKGTSISHAEANDVADDLHYIRDVQITRQTQSPGFMPFLRKRAVASATFTGVGVWGHQWGTPGVHNPNVAYAGSVDIPLTGVTFAHNPGFAIFWTSTPDTRTAGKYWWAMYANGGTSVDANGLAVKVHTTTTQLNIARAVGADPLALNVTDGASAGTAYCHCLVMDNGTATLYTNGVSKGSDTYDDLTTMAPDWLRLGADEAGNAASRTTTLYKRVLVMTRAPTAAEVARISNVMMYGV